MTVTKQMLSHMSLNRSLQYAGLSKATWYYKPHPKKPSFDGTIMEKVRDIKLKRPTYGTRRMAAQLSREMDTPINRKKIQRIYKELGWNQAQKLPKHDTLARKLFKPSEPNQLWETDMTYVWCDDKTWCYCFNVVDAFTRKWISYILAPTATADNALQAVLDALSTIPEEKYGDLRIRMDNGSQYTSRLFKENMSTLGIKCEYIWIHTPQQNGHVESFHKTFKKEYLWPNELPTFQVAEKVIRAAFIDYNEHRIHSSLGYLTPNEYIYLWKQVEEDKIMQYIIRKNHSKSVQKTRVQINQKGFSMIKVELLEELEKAS